MEDYKKLIENSTHQITDENLNKWKVIELSDLEEIMQAYHQDKVKTLGLFSVIERAFWQGRKCVKHQDFEDWFTKDIKNEIKSMFL